MCEIDNHELHITEHITYMLSNEYKNLIEQDNSLEEIFLKHIRLHKQMKVMEQDMSKQ
mgnify:FL=1